MIFMFRMLFFIPLFFFMAINANSAEIFSDDFDDSSWTDAHWDVFKQSWSHVSISGSDLGYQGFEPSEFAVSAANNSALYSNADLILRVDLRIDDTLGNRSNENSAFLLFSADTSKSEVNYAYSARVQIDYEDSIEFTLELKVNDTTLARVNYDSLSLGAWYTLIIQTDSNETIDVYLYDDYPSSPPIGSITGVSPTLPIHYGKVALAATGQVTYNNFSISAAGDAHIDLTCISAKLKAASTLCKSLANCCSKDIKKPDGDKLGACEDKSYAKFEKSWTKAEDKATKKGLNCDTDDASEFISSIDDGGIYLIHQEIEANVLDTKDGRNLASSLLKAAGTYCSSIFKAESANKKKADQGKLSGSLGKAEAKFQRSWDKAIAKALKKGTTYNGDIATIEGLIDDMVDDVLDSIQ